MQETVCIHNVGATTGHSSVTVKLQSSASTQHSMRLLKAAGTHQLVQLAANHKGVKLSVAMLLSISKPWPGREGGWARQEGTQVLPSAHVGYTGLCPYLTLSRVCVSLISKAKITPA